ncbi:MAG: ABC transporter permease [Candidatus Aenigmatarchaeota archaeon]|nr:ABC transporter permease [Candidatus Aenigmarchaeota archaeon]
MKINRILALLYKDFLIFFRVKWRLAETFYFPITTILIWGLFSIFMEKFAFEAGLIVLIMNIFWNFAYVAQSTTNMSMLEDVWSGSFKQLFVSGITPTEFVIARLLFSSIISIFIILIMSLISYYVFDLSLITEKFGIFLILTLITMISSLALAVLIAALLFVFGKEYGFLAWTALQLFILLSAPFYTVDILPKPLQYISQLMPYTDVFESARNLITTSTVSFNLIVRGLVISISYLLISFPVYYFAFNLAKKNGNLVRLS